MDELILGKRLQLVDQMVGESPGVLLANGVEQGGWCLVKRLVSQVLSIEHHPNNLTARRSVCVLTPDNDKIPGIQG